MWGCSKNFRRHFHVKYVELFVWLLWSSSAFLLSSALFSSSLPLSPLSSVSSPLLAHCALPLIFPTSYFSLFFFYSLHFTSPSPLLSAYSQICLLFSSLFSLRWLAFPPITSSASLPLHSSCPHFFIVAHAFNHPHHPSVKMFLVPSSALKCGSWLTVPPLFPLQHR